MVVREMSDLTPGEAWRGSDWDIGISFVLLRWDILGLIFDFIERCFEKGDVFSQPSLLLDF